MKVWNKNINSCCECYHCDGDSCNITKEFLNSRSEIINDNCPFAQPITEQVIEGFGFKFNKYWKDYSIYRKNDSMYSKDEIDLWIAYHNKWYVVYIKTNHVGEFKGIVNNPKELEFILHSIRVIE